MTKYIWPQPLSAIMLRFCQTIKNVDVWLSAFVHRMRCVLECRQRADSSYATIGKNLGFIIVFLREPMKPKKTNGTNWSWSSQNLHILTKIKNQFIFASESHIESESFDFLSICRFRDFSLSKLLIFLSICRFCDFPYQNVRFF